MGSSKLVQNAYTTYAKTINFQDSLGNSIPTWQDLPEKMKQAWMAAINQVIKDTESDKDAGK